MRPVLICVSHRRLAFRRLLPLLCLSRTGGLPRQTSVAQRVLRRSAGRNSAIRQSPRRHGARRWAARFSVYNITSNSAAVETGGWDCVALESPVDVPGQCVGGNAPRSPAPMLEAAQGVSAMRLASSATYAETPIDIPYRRFSITRILALGPS